MLADWLALARVFNNPGDKWYQGNRDKIKLHPDTRAWIEEQLGL
jgi:hypothetical protein